MLCQAHTRHLSSPREHHRHCDFCPVFKAKLLKLKFDGFRWCTAIFKSYHRFSIGLRSGIWLGHSKTFRCFPINHSSVALTVCLGSLSCWKVNLHPSLKSLEDWSSHPSFLQFWLVSQSLPMKNIPTAWCCHHHASLWVFSGWGEVLGLRQT